MFSTTWFAERHCQEKVLYLPERADRSILCTLSFSSGFVSEFGRERLLEHEVAIVGDAACICQVRHNGIELAEEGFQVCQTPVPRILAKAQLLSRVMQC